MNKNRKCGHHTLEGGRYGEKITNRDRNPIT